MFPKYSTVPNADANTSSGEGHIQASILDEILAMRSSHTASPTAPGASGC